LFINVAASFLSVERIPSFNHWKIGSNSADVAKGLQSLQAHADVSALLTAATDHQSRYQLLATVGFHDHY